MSPSTLATYGSNRPWSTIDWAIAGLTSTLSGMSSCPASVFTASSSSLDEALGLATGFSTPGYLSRKLCRMPL